MALEIGKSFVIGVDDKLLEPKVVLPSLKNPDQSVELLVICWIVKSGSRQLLAKIGNGAPVLKKYPADANIGSITLHFKSLREVRELEKGGIAKAILKS